MQSPDMQNPGGCIAGASRDCFGGLSLHFPTASDKRAQLFASRFGLNPWLARDYAWLCFGEGCND